MTSSVEYLSDRHDLRIIKMSQQSLETKVHLVKVDQKSLGNNLTEIQWPQLNKKQAERIQGVFIPNVSKNVVFKLRSRTISQFLLL